MHLSLSLFLLMMCTDAPESTTNSRTSGFFEVGAGINLASMGVENLALPAFLSFKYFRQITCYSAGASFLVQGLLM